MENMNFCQSCSMPLDNPAVLGTEKDGSKSHEYCQYCYQDGAFINPKMSLKEMTSLVITQMEKKNIDPRIIDMAVSSLPSLNRWRTKMQYCQSCSMPLDNPELLGTEKDGSSSSEYCKYCYQNGEFTHPGITLVEMKERMTKLLDKEKLPEDILEAAISRLPHLKRWSKKVTLHS